MVSKQCAHRLWLLVKQKGVHVHVQRASLQRLVAWVITQADRRRLGHNDVDERDSSRAQFVVRQLGERGRQRNKGGDHRLLLMGLCAQFYNTKNKAVSTYSLGYQSVSKGKVTGESCACCPVALGMSGKVVGSHVSSAVHLGALHLLGGL